MHPNTPERVQIYNFISSQIELEKSALNTLNQYIYTNPELPHEEHSTHDVLTSVFEGVDFVVTRHAHGLETAFRAEYSVKGREGGRNIGVNAEYDALPGPDKHACGHNLIATAAVATATSLARALKHFSLPGTITVLGTPAEEGGGGKITMLQNHAYDNIDACLMTHPSNRSQAYLRSIAGLTNLSITYHGRNAHSGIAPWEGVNSLDAITLMWTSVGLMRQQLMPTDRVGGVITDGGVGNNVCPDFSKGSFGIRAESVERLEVVKEKVLGCARGAATATGCECEVVEDGWLYADIRTNDVIAGRYAAHLEMLGRPWAEGKNEQKRNVFGGGTDMGNVSYVVPSIHPTFDIGCKEGCHTDEFYEAAGTYHAFEECLVSAKGMALSAIDIMLDDGVYSEMKKEFEDMKKSIGHCKANFGNSTLNTV
ncbi:amidohydrolase [Tuber brumale]|nr:amidohydrolase [Tuber brumale]